MSLTTITEDKIWVFENKGAPLATTAAIHYWQISPLLSSPWGKILQPKIPLKQDNFELGKQRNKMNWETLFWRNEAYSAQGSALRKEVWMGCKMAAVATQPFFVLLLVPWKACSTRWSELACLGHNTPVRRDKAHGILFSQGTISSSLEYSVSFLSLSWEIALFVHHRCVENIWTFLPPQHHGRLAPTHSKT